MSIAPRRRRDPFFEGKAAIVTGGTRGLGLVLARELLARGASVAVCARDGREVAAARTELCERGAAYAAECDITDFGQVERFVAAVEERFGRIDILINDAGTIVVAPYFDLTLEDVRRVVEANFFGAVNAMHAVLPHMRRRRSGSIVNVSSVGGLIGMPHLSAYCASKFALNGFSETVAAEVRRDGVRVTVVNPGLMRTGSPLNATFKGSTKAEYGWFALSDALPFLSMPAQKAARQILHACRRGKPFVVLSLPAKVAAFAHALSPGAFMRVMALVNALLPAPTGDRSHAARGHESESEIAPSPLTRASDRAARENNELAARREARDLPD